MTDQVVLYGGKLSLYTARVRSYLRHQRIPFVERAPGTDRAMTEIYPKLGRRIVPVVELPDGTILQDGARIIDHFEATAAPRNPAYPDDPALNVVARLFDLFGNEGLMRPAMHYRWNVPEQEPFVRHIFSETMPFDRDAAAQDADFAKLSGFLKKWTAMVGASVENADMIEEAYLDFLDRLNAHFAVMPFLLGARPTIADYALFGPMFAHLGRDRVPLAIMLERAPYVFDWTERMNAFEDCEDRVSQVWGDDMVDLSNPPETLVKLLEYIAQDYVPEFVASHTLCEQFLKDQPNEPIPCSRPFGATQAKVRGVTLPVPAKAYRHFLSQRIADAFDAAPEPAQKQVRDLFERIGLTAFIDLRLPRRVGWHETREAWEPAAEPVETKQQQEPAE